MLNNYKIFETNEFLKKMQKIPKRNKAFVENKLTNFVYPQIKEEPYYGNNIKKLVGYQPETWRYRIGKYRIFYLIDKAEKTVYMLSVDLRKDAY